MSRKKIQTVALLFLLATLLGLMSFGVLVTDRMANGSPLDWPYHLVNEFSGIYLGFLSLPLLLWFFRRYPISRKNLWKRLPLHLGATMVFGLLLTFSMYAVRSVLYPVFDLGSYPEYYGLLKYRIVMEYFKQFIAYWLIYGVFLFFQKQRETQEQRLRAAQLEQQLSKARLQALHMQLNPHFLFNTLNLISSEMYNDPRTADRMITALSDMLRLTLGAREREEHSLQKEIELIERYLDIMHMRFGDKLAVRVEVDPGIGDAQVPVFLLQPLVENAVKYSADNLDGAEIDLRAGQSGDRLIIRLSDNGPGLGGSQNRKSGQGLGLTNTLDRLEELYGKSYAFTIENREAGGVNIELAIPLRRVSPGKTLQS